MTPEQLIAEGRALQRDCVFLEFDGSGPVAAVWHEHDRAEVSKTGFGCSITVDTQYIPALRGSVNGFLSVYTDEKGLVGGRVERSSSYQRPGKLLHARSVDVLPPIDAVFARGSAEVGAWIESHGWGREERYNDNFGGRGVVVEYERVHMNEYPLYLRAGPAAVLGGWHWPGPDDDWHSLIDEQLLVLTLHDAEPWVEAWRLATGEFKVIQRTT